MKLRAWRIVQEHHVANAFDGEGARVYGGRWNKPGTKLVYCSQSISLATLEILVNLESGQALARYVSIPVDFGEDLCTEITPGEFPDDWASDPPPISAQQYGSTWAAAQASVVLAVPSAVVQSETNYLINPAHPEFPALEIGSASPLEMDRRLMR